MSGTDAVFEPEFVGEGRKLLVKSLVNIYKKVRDDSVPVWVALEAPSGWGKTRIAREFYAELAETQQSDQKYWPRSIFSSTDERQDLSDVNARRKHVNPSFNHDPHSLPSYLWWGISCFERGQIADDALAQDFRFLQAHEPYLTVAWGKQNALERDAVPAVSRLANYIADQFTSSGKAAALDIAKDIAHEVLGAALPGFGWLLKLGASAAADVARRVRDEAKLAAGSDSIAHTHRDAVDDAYLILTRLSKPKLPIVLFIEDVHHADVVLLELIERLVRSDAPIMIVTTGWPGVMGKQDELIAPMRVAADRLLRVRHDDECLPAPFAAGASLGQLTSEELTPVATHYHSNIEPRTLEMLLEKYAVPLELELVLLAYAPSMREGKQFKLSESDVAALPPEIEEIYAALWKKLPSETQRALSHSTLGIPAVILNDITKGRAWDSTLMAAALSDDGVLDPEAYQAAVTAGIDRYSWVRKTGLSRQFNEATQLHVASRRHGLGESSRTDIQQLLLTHAATRLESIAEADADAKITQEVLQAAGLVLALAEVDGLNVTISHELFMSATLAIMRHLRDLPRELPQLVALGETAFSTPLDLEKKEDRQILLAYASALTGAGRHTDAIRVLEESTAELITAQGADAPDVLEGRGLHAWAVLEGGKPDVAAELFRILITDRSRISGHDDPTVMSDRRSLAIATADAGRPDEAIKLHRVLMDDQVRWLGANHRDILVTRHALADAVSSAGRPDEALELYRALLNHELRELGADHPDVLVTRHNEALAMLETGHSDEAVTLYRSLLDDRIRLVGPDHPSVLATRNNLAAAVDYAGHPEDAVKLFRVLLDDRVRVLGAEHPDVLSTRNLLAGAISRAGRPDQATQLYRALIGDYTRVLGADHPSTMAIRNNLAWAASAAGRPDEAAQLFCVLLDDQVRVLGVDNPGAFLTRRNWASAVLSEGHSVEAVAMLVALLDDQARVLGRDHPDQLMTRNKLAYATMKAGRPDDAIALFQILLLDLERVLGPDHLDVLTTRKDLAMAFSEAGQPDFAAEQMRDILRNQESALGAAHPEVLKSRNNLALMVASAGRAAEAVDLYRGLLEDQVLVLGADHPELLTTRNNLARALIDAGNPVDGVEMYRELLLDLVRVFGASHPYVRMAQDSMEHGIDACGR